MGTIAARDCQRLLTLTEQVTAAGLLASWQGLALRLRSGDLRLEDLQPSMRACHEQTAGFFELLVQDRALEPDLREAMQRIRDRYWVLYD